MHEQKRELGAGALSTKVDGVGARGLQICFWNIAGLMNKDKQFWEYLKEYDIVGLIETWIKVKVGER